MIIQAASVSVVRPKYHIIKDTSLDRLVLSRYMITPIKMVLDWRYIHQSKQAQIEKYVIHESSTRINYDYKFGYQVMLRKKVAYKCTTQIKDM